MKGGSHFTNEDAEEIGNQPGLTQDLSGCLTQCSSSYTGPACSSGITEKTASPSRAIAHLRAGRSQRAMALTSGRVRSGGWCQLHMVSAEKRMNPQAAMHRGSAHGFRVFLAVPDGSAAGGVQAERFLPSLVYCRHRPGGALTPVLRERMASVT